MVTVREYKKRGKSCGWEVDIRTVLPDGTKIRERRKSPVGSKNGSKRWAEQREQHLIRERREEASKQPPKPRREVPRLADFAERFMTRYVEAERMKPSTIAAKKSILSQHLVPLLGSKRLDEITNEDVQAIKNHLHDRAGATVNTVLTTLSVMLKVAVDWGDIDRMPCTIKLLKLDQPEASFYDFGEYERIVTCAELAGPLAHLVALLGGDAGLRCGEMMALQWADIDFANRMITVCRSEWNGHLGSTKGRRSRQVPMTTRLSATLQGCRHLRSSRVLCERDGRPITKRVVQRLVERVARRANVKPGVHRLRHTFCSHLAMKGAPVRAIMEVAGHRDLSTTQRYMHLSPAAIQDAIRLLEKGSCGEIVETASGSK